MNHRKLSLGICVDAHKKEMIWEGVAQGRLRDEDMNNPRDAIARVVTQVFALPRPPRHRRRLARVGLAVAVTVLHTYWITALSTRILAER